MMRMFNFYENIGAPPPLKPLTFEDLKSSLEVNFPLEDYRQRASNRV